MPALWNLGGLRWKALGRRVWAELSEDGILGRSAQLSFYFLLSLFPMLLLIMALVVASPAPKPRRAPGWSSCSTR